MKKLFGRRSRNPRDEARIARCLKRAVVTGPTAVRGSLFETLTAWECHEPEKCIVTLVGLKAALRRERNSSVVLDRFEREMAIRERKKETMDRDQTAAAAALDQRAVQEMERQGHSGLWDICGFKSVQLPRGATVSWSFNHSCSHSESQEASFLEGIQSGTISVLTMTSKSSQFAGYRCFVIAPHCEDAIGYHAVGNTSVKGRGSVNIQPIAEPLVFGDHRRTKLERFLSDNRFALIRTLGRDSPTFYQDGLRWQGRGQHYTARVTFLCEVWKKKASNPYF